MKDGSANNGRPNSIARLQIEKSAPPCGFSA